MKKGSAVARIPVFLLVAVLLSVASFAATVSTGTLARQQSKSKTVTEKPSAQKKMSHLRHSRRTTAAASPAARRRAAALASRRRKTAAASTTVVATAHGRRTVKKHRYYERFTASSFAKDIGEGDLIAGEDPVVRQAAIEALGGMNGTLVAIDPASGRVLAMVNQKLALSAGATPCSTIKVPVALAALSAGLITKETQVAITRSWHMDLTDALAHSNNAYFETVGRQLGFEKYSHYAHQFGLGELAGWNIEGEHLGAFPSVPLDNRLGGVGKMCSFGESIFMTPLQLGALMSAVANGGTLYWLQHPASPEEITNFVPRVKRTLDIKGLVPEISDGMAGAVRYGTARSLRVNFSEEQVLGKTGTCSEGGTRYGWFTSFANTQYGRIVAVIFLEGGRPTFGPKAAELAGHFYRNLYDHSYFAAKDQIVTPVPVDAAAGASTAVGAPR